MLPGGAHRSCCGSSDGQNTLDVLPSHLYLLSPVSDYSALTDDTLSKCFTVIVMI